MIYGADAKVRGAISGLAEQTKTNLLGLLRQRDEWQTPVVINLQSQQSNLPELPPADLRISQTGFGIKLQLDLTILKDVDIALVERELLRAILLEMVYRKQPHISTGAVLVEPPDWLIDGALALSPGRDRVALIEAVAITDQPLPLEKFLRQRPAPFDSTARMRQALFPQHPYALRSNGSVEAVQRLTQKNLVDFRDRYIVAKNGVIYVFGDVKAVEVKQLIEQTLGKMQPGALALTDAKPSIPLSKSETVESRKDKAQGVLMSPNKPSCIICALVSR